MTRPSAGSCTILSSNANDDPLFGLYIRYTKSSQSNSHISKHAFAAQKLKKSLAVKKCSGELSLPNLVEKKDIDECLF